MFKFRTSYTAARFLAAFTFLGFLSVATRAAQWPTGLTAPQNVRGKTGHFGTRLLSKRTSSRVLRGASSSYFAASGFLSRANGTTLNFTFSGFEAQRQAQLSAFAQAIYPFLVQVYGEPAPSQRGQTVPVIFNANAGDGVYDLQSGAPGTIKYSPYSVADLQAVFADAQGNCDATCQSNAEAVALQRDQYNISRQMALAFHGAQGFQADAWELGFSNAAALVANWKYYNSTPAFNPAILGDYYLPGYDFFNRPGIGNRYFFSSTGTSGTDGFLASTRSTIAQAAWLKVWIENPDFFLLFNRTYYARYAESLRSDDAMLNTLAASIVPTVEGLAWETWRAQQQILNTTIVSGSKLILIAVPLVNLEAGDTRSVFATFAFRFRTGSNGDDTPLSGVDVGQFVVTDESGRDITSLSAELRGGQKLSFDGEGASYFNVPGQLPIKDPLIGFAGTATSANGNREQARLTVNLLVGSQQVNTIFPYGVAGTVSKANGIYGATTKTVSGRVSVALVSTTTVTDKATLARGAFGSALTYPSSANVKATLQLLPADGSTGQVFRRNFAWSYNNGPQGVGVILEDSASTPDPTPTPTTTPAPSSVTATWPIRGQNHWRLVSLPITPSETDAARVFQTPANELKLGRFRSTLTPTPATGTRFIFGIDATRNDAYPHLPQNVAPGRGYWLYLPQSRRITVPGTLLPTDAPASVRLESGWNSIGVPFPAPFNVGALQVKSGGLTISWNEAIARRWLMPGVWSWKQDGGYKRVDLTAGAAVYPYEGYFVYAVPGRALELVFDPTKRSGALTVESDETTGENWRVAMNVRTRTTREDDFAFGVVPQTATRQFAAPRPPAGERSVLLWFQNSGDRTAESSGAGRESGWSQSFQAPIATRGNWEFFVDGAAAGELVLLSWGDTRVVPSNLMLTLVDLENGKRTVMTASATSAGANSYLFTMGNVARRFQIEATPRALQEKSD